MRDRRPFPDIEEQPRVDVGLDAEYLKRFSEKLDTAMRGPPTPSPLPLTNWHTAENRRQRRKAVATFEAPKDLPADEADGLRRRLLEQRQARALGTLDVALRRLQRKALRK